MRRAWPGLVVLALWAMLAGATSLAALRQYDRLESGWSWDLAYYNQWFWALTRGDGTLTVRPLGPFTQEGPSIWSMNYLTPARLLIAPVYAAVPDPRTLLVVQVIVIWLVVPAVFDLARDESGSDRVALSAALLVPLTPLLWPLALNDFRELQLVPPFVVWAVQGVRGRRPGRTVLGVAGLLACRQEMAFLVASLAFLPPARPEAVARRVRWARALWLVGLGWMLLGFLVYMRWFVNARVLPLLEGATGAAAGLGWRIEVAAGLLTIGVGVWGALALARPRAAILVLPWAWAVTGGLFRLDQLGRVEWHHVRYTAPLVGMALAAGSLGYARLARLWLDQAQPRRLAVAWVGFLVVGGITTAVVNARFAGRARPVVQADVAALRYWLARVGPSDGVLADYSVCAPLSSRATLYSDVMDQNKPPGYPRLDPAITWCFLDRARGMPDLAAQGFASVYEGTKLRVFQRVAKPEVSREPSATRRPPWPHGGLVRQIRHQGLSPWGGTASATDQLVYLGFDLVSTLVCFAPWLFLRFYRPRLEQPARAMTATATTAETLARALVAATEEPGVTVEVVADAAPAVFDRESARLRIPERLARSTRASDLATVAILVARAGDEARGREPWAIGVALARATGWLLVAAGVALVDFTPIEAGGVVLSAEALSRLVAPARFGRAIRCRAARLVEASSVLNPDERRAVLAAVGWAE